MGLPDYKEIMELVKKGLTLEAQEKIMELRTSALELQEQNINLRERVKALESERALSRSLTFNAASGVYWLAKDNDQRDGPFCQVCHDRDQKLIRIHPYRGKGTPDFHYCHVCKNKFYVRQVQDSSRRD